MKQTSSPGQTAFPDPTGEGAIGTHSRPDDMNARIPPLPVERRMRRTNLVLALCFLVLALWLLVADLATTTHLILQDSVSTTLLLIFLGLWGFAAHVVAAFPKRFIIPATILMTCRFCIAWPVYPAIGFRSACLALDSAMIGVAAMHVASTLRGRLFQGREWVGIRHSIAMVAASLVITGASLFMLAFGAAALVKDLTRGYVQLTGAGVELAERVFEKDGREVHLIGMSHVADPAFYEQINERLDGGGLVLAEGVRDERGLIPSSVEEGIDHEGMAGALGIAAQSEKVRALGRDGSGDAADEGIRVVNADIDYSELSETHRRHFAVLFEHALDPDPAKRFVMPEGITVEDIESLFVDGLLEQRNDRLMETYDREGAGHTRVFMPWGAAHLGDIEVRLLARGYRLVGESRRLSLDYRTVLDALAQRLGRR